MAIFDNQKVDYLWKKLGYGRSKTDVNSIKNATNESIASPLFLRGDTIWSQSDHIPSVIPTSTTEFVQIYPTSTPVECTVDITASPNRTWKTNLIDWIPPEMGATYNIKVYVHTAGQASNAATSGDQLFAAGSGNDDEWFFDYQSGTLNFIGDNLPNGINFSGKSVYISGARYTGIKGVPAPGAATTFTSVGIGSDLTVIGFSTFTGTVDLNGGAYLDNIQIGITDDNEIDTTTGNLVIDSAGGQVTIDDRLIVTGISTFNSDVDINANVDISGYLDVDGRTELDTTNISETLNVTGISTFASDVDINADLDVDGRTELDTTNISETLNVVGVSTFGSTVDINADLLVDGRTELETTNISGTLDVVGVSTFGSDVDINANVDISSNLTINGTLGVDGDATFSNVAAGIVTVSELHTGFLGSAIRVTSDSITGPSTITIDPSGVGDNTGLLIIKGDLQVDGTQTIINSTSVTVDDLNIMLADGAANDAAADGGGITVQSGEGNKTFQFESTGDNFGSSENINLATGKTYKIANTEVLSSTKLTVANINSSGIGTIETLDTTTGAIDYLTSIHIDNAGIATFQGNIYAYGNIDLSGDLDVDGRTELDTTNISETLNVVGISTFGSDVDINANVDISGYLDVDGRTELDTTNISETLNVVGVSTFASDVDINADLDVDGRTELDTTNISETLNVVGVSTFGSDVDINANVDISGYLDVDGRAELDTTNISETLNVVGVSTFGSDVDINASVDVSGNINVTTLNVTGVSTFQSNVYLGDNDTLNFGDGIDLQIFSDGSTSYIQETSASSALWIKSNSTEIRGSGNQLIAKFVDSASAELYYGSGDKKFETTAYGVNITGTTDTDGLIVSGVSTFTGSINSDGDLDVDGYTELDSTNISETLNVVGVSTFGSDVDINANVDIDGRTELDTTNISETLNVVGVSTFGSDVDINANVDIDGYTELDSTNISETLNVVGVSTFGSDVDINANVDIDGRTELDSTNISETLNVVGISTFGSDVDINANVDISGYLDVDGRTELDTTNISETLNVVGISTFASDVDINANVDISGYLDVDGYTELDATNISETLNVVGVSTFASDVDINASVDISGNLVLHGDLDVDGRIELDTTNISETLNVVGVSTFASDVDINANVDISGYLDVDGRTELDTTNISETLNVVGVSTFASDVDIDGSLDVDGRTELDTTNISETLNVVGISTFESDVDINGDLDVDGRTELDTTNISETLNVVGVSTFASDVDINANVDIDGRTELDTTNISETLNVVGVSTFASDVDINANLDVDGHTELDNVNVSGIITATSFHTGVEGSSIIVTSDTITGPSTITIDPSGIGDNTGLLIIKGDLQVDGTQTIVNSTTVTVDDKNIVLGSGAANDAAADGGGITLESGDGDKTFNWVDSTDSWTSSENLDLASGKVYKISNTEVLSSSQLTVSNINSSGIGTIETLDTTTGTIDYLSGTNVSYSGIGTIATLDTTTGSIDYLSGTNVSYSGIGTIETLDTTTGTIDYLSGVDATYSGIGTIATLDTTVGTIDYLSGTNVSYSGIGTIETLDTTVGTIDHLSGVDVSYSGIGTIETLDTTTGTIDYLSGTNVSYSGIGTIETLDTTTGTIDYLSGTNLNYSGITTLGSVVVGGATTELVVNGDARITGILTVGPSSVTIDGVNNEITVGTGLTIYSDSIGIGTITLNEETISTLYDISGGTASFGGGINVAGIVTASKFDGDLNALGKTYYVATTGSDSNSGNNINEPYLTIAQALSVATNGDIINISAGVYEETCPLVVPRGVTIKGAGLRATTIRPTTATKQENVFHLNDISTVEDFTIRGSYFDTSADTGYAFAYAPGIAITTRSPYVQRVTVLNTGSNITSTDPYGYDTADSPPTSYIAGAGAKVDGSLVASNSLEAGMLFNEVTFFTPNSKGIVLTNGARAEYLNCFHYFASQAIVGLAGTVGIAGTADARLKFSNPGVTPSVNDVVKLFEGGVGIATGTITSYSNDYATIDGLGIGTFTSVGIGTTQDVRFYQSDGVTQTGIASAILLADYTMFGAEMRSVGCAVEYGSQGVVADGNGVKLRMFATNFNHVGSGKDFTNDSTLTVQANEVVETNGGQVSYVSIDQSGDFRVGDALYINQETGNVSFAATSYSLDVTGEIDVTDGTNTSTLAPTSLTVGGLQIAANTLSSTSGNIIIDPAGSNKTIVQGDLGVVGILTASVINVDAFQKGDTSISISDTGSDGTIIFNTDGSEAFRINNSQTTVFTGSIDANGNLDVDGHTDLDNVSIAGVTTFSGAIDADGNVDVAGTLDVDGHTELDNVNVSGIITATGFVGPLTGDVTGTATTATKVTVSSSGSATVHYLMMSSALAGSSSVRTNSGIKYDILSNSLILGNNISVAGVSTFGGQIDANGDLDVDGRTELDTTNISETLNVVGVSTFASDVDINANVDVSGYLDVDGHTELDNVNVSGIITATEFHTGVSGSSIIVKNDTITGPSTIFIDPSGIGDNTGIVRIKGGLVVDGTQFIVQSSVISLADFNVGIATTVGSNVLLDGAGIGIGSTGIRKTFFYDYSSDSLKVSENFDVPAGKVYKIAEQEVIREGQLTIANINSSGIGTIETLDTTTGTIDYLSGTNVSYSGIGTIITLNATTGNITTLDTTVGTIDYLSGTNVSYSGVGTIATLDTTTGTIDYLSGTNVSYSGIGTIETLDTTTGTIDYLSGTNVSYSGVGTITTLDTTTGTIDYLSGTDVTYSGIGTIETLDTTTGTIDYLSGIDVSYSGIGTIETLDTTTGTIDYLTTTNINNLGIATFVGEASFGNITAGIVTATNFNGTVYATGSGEALHGTHVGPISWNAADPSGDFILTPGDGSTVAAAFTGNVTGNLSGTSVVATGIITASSFDGTVYATGSGEALYGTHVGKISYNSLDPTTGIILDPGDGLVAAAFTGNVTGDVLDASANVMVDISTGDINANRVFAVGIGGASTGQVLTTYLVATAIGYNALDPTDTSSHILTVGDEFTQATYYGDIVDSNGSVVLDISAKTFAGTATTATNLEDAANITTGTIDDSRLPDLITSNINVTSGVSTFSSIETTNITSSYYDTVQTRTGSSVHVTNAVTPFSVLDLDVSVFRSAEILIQSSELTNMHLTKLLVIHDGVTAYLTEYGSIYNNTINATFDVIIAGGYMQLMVTPSTGSATEFKVSYTAIRI